MKKLILPLLIWILCMNLVVAQEASDFIYTGNTIRYSDSGLNGAPGKIGGAVQLTLQKLELLKGNNITRIRFYLKSGQAENTSVFVTRSLSGAPDYTQAVENAETGWNDITLTQPFPVNGQELFIGYETEGANIQLGTNSNTENGLNDWLLENGTWRHSTPSRGMCVTGIVQGNNLPLHNVSLTSAQVPYYQLTDKPFTIKGDFFNLAAETIHNITLSITVNGEEIAQRTVDNLNVPYLSSGNFTVPDIIIPLEGEVSFTISVIRENGSGDQDMENSRYTQNILCRKEFAQRKVMVEIFSTENCNNCPAGHEKIEHAIGNNPDITMVNHHSAFGKDPYTIDASVAYEFFYGKGEGTFAPALMIDRTCLGPQGAFNRGTNIANTPIMSSGSDLEYLMEYGYNTPAYATVNLNTVYKEENRTLSIDVEGISVLPLPVTDNRVNIYITEDSIFSTKQAGAVGNYMHNHTIRQTVTGTWGEPISLEEGFNKSYQVSIPAEWNDKNLNVVAFVSGYAEDDTNKRMVYNTDFAQLFERASGIGSTQATGGIRLYTSGNSVNIDGEYKRLNIYNVTGGKIARLPAGTTRINASSLGTGIRIFRFETADGTFQTIKANLF